MALPESASNGAVQAQSDFAPTRWSLVLKAAGADSSASADALAKLCRTYWYPLYLYVRRSGHGAEDAQDLTQGFFARLLETKLVDAADREKGKFRSFLLMALKRFLATEWERANRQKRGGGQEVLSLDEENTESRFLAEPADEMTPEKSFERRWALTLLEQALRRLEKEYASAGKAELFKELQPLLTGDKPDDSYADMAARLQMTEGTLRVALHRVRHRYREALRAEVADTVASPDEIDDEIRHLSAALSR